MGIAPSNDVEMVEDEANAIPEEIKSIVGNTLEALSTTRKKRKMVDEYATVDTVRTFEQKQSIPSLHASSSAGINSIVVSTKSADSSVFVTGGSDKVVQVYDAANQKVLHTLKGHTKKVNHVAWSEDDDGTSLIISASADKTARVWGYDENSSTYAPKQTFKTHKGDVVGLGIHPSKKFAALASADKTFSLHDLNTFQTVYQSGSFEIPHQSLAFHPDGHFIGLGSSAGSIHIVDLRVGTSVAELGESSEAGRFNIGTLSFSENGWQMAATGSVEGDVVSLWDLRKQKATLSLELGENFKLHSLLFDYSAAWLGAAGGAGLKLFAPNKTKELLWSTDGEVTSLCFGALGQTVWGAGGREVRVWGV
jgi:pre-mRNA-processing factor 19